MYDYQRLSAGLCTIISDYQLDYVRLSAGSLYQALILLKIIDIYNFFMLHFSAMKLLLFLLL